MKQFKVAGLIAASHLSKLVVNLFIMKQIAVRYGPEGLGFLGNFMSLVVLATTLAGGGIVTGIIKYVSQYAHTKKRLSSFISSAFLYTLICSIIVLMIGSLLVNSITDYVFLSREFKHFIYFFFIAQVFVAINNFAFGVINGLRKTKIYSLCTISGNAIAFIISLYMIPHYGYWGAIISISAPAFAAFIPLMGYLLIERVSLKRHFNLSFSSLAKDSVLLSKYSLMLICSAICFPIVEMTVRNFIAQSINLDVAGYWQAITRLSSAYLSFYSLFLSFYFVPIISATTDKKIIIIQVKKMMMFILIMFLPMLVLFSIFKLHMIQFVFSADFLPVADLFILQMLGDLFRVLGWIIGFIIVAKALLRLYILSEVLQASLFIILSYWQLTYSQELQSVIFAYVGSCVMYFILSFSLFYYMFCHKTGEIIEIKNL